MSETPETRKLDSYAECETGQTFFERLSREERQMVLAGMRNDTEYTAIVTQLRSALDDQDLRDRDR